MAEVKTYAVIKAGAIDNLVLWDGETPYEHGGDEIVLFEAEKAPEGTGLGARVTGKGKSRRFTPVEAGDDAGLGTGAVEPALSR